MNEDDETRARTEAERIVGEFERGASEVHVNGWNSHREASGRDRLVAALAAAIATVEHYTNGSAYMEQVLDEQTAALSALRARAGEGEWPSHIKADAPYLVCDRCGRKEWAIDWDGECSMTQPDGHPCGGTLARAGEETG